MRDGKYFKLYWCSTSDHGEDWFIVARSAATARKIHELEEGYAGKEASSEYVCRLPKRFQNSDQFKEDGGWPDEEMLIACGARYLHHGPEVLLFPDNPKFAGRYFVEGCMAFNFEDAAFKHNLVQRYGKKKEIQS